MPTLSRSGFDGRGLTSSKACGHTYSKEGIMSLLKSKKTVNCPVAGCGKKVSENSLIPDDDMVWKMVRLKTCGIDL